MTEYFLGLIAFSFFGAMIFSLVPNGMSKSYVRLLCGLCSIGCIAFPIFSLLGSGEGAYDVSELFTPSYNAYENSVEIYNNSLNNATVKNAEEILKNDIIKVNSVKYDDINVKISLGQNGDEFYIKSVKIYLYRSAYAVDPKIIEKICQERLCAGCEIIYK